MTNMLSKMTVESLYKNCVNASAKGCNFRVISQNERIRVWVDNFEKIEPEILEWLDSIENDEVIWDVGASIGLFTMWAAVRKRRTVVAFEPEAQNFSILEANHFLNKNQIQGLLHTFCIALSDKVDSDFIYLRDYGAGEHGKILGQRLARGGISDFKPHHVQSILSFTLDYLVRYFNIPQPTFLKIDVDGSEYKILTGAEEALKNGKIKSIYIELDIKSPHYSKTIRILLNHGYKEIHRFPVVKLSGGYYKNLFNFIFEKD